MFETVKILVIGSEKIYNGLVAALPRNVDCRHSNQAFAEPGRSCVREDENYDVVFDAIFDERNELPEYFIYPTSHLIIGNCIQRKLDASKKLFEKNMVAEVAGMNLLPTFISSTVKEVCFNDDEAESRFKEITEKFNWQYKKVKDEIGLVAMRVLSMIINEAAKTLEEGTATKEDIDRGMELGTGYPQGPLKWCDIIGIENVNSVLKSLHESTNDGRYRIAPLLLRMQERRETFY